MLILVAKRNKCENVPVDINTIVPYIVIQDNIKIGFTGFVRSSVPIGAINLSVYCFFHVSGNTSTMA